MSHVSHEKKEKKNEPHAKLDVAKRKLHNEDCPNIHSYQYDDIADIECPIPKDFKTRNINQLLTVISRARHNKHCQKLHEISKNQTKLTQLKDIGSEVKSTYCTSQALNSG